MSRPQVTGSLHAISERPDFEEATSRHRSPVSPLRVAVAPKVAALARQDAGHFGPVCLELEPALSVQPVAEAWWQKVQLVVTLDSPHVFPQLEYRLIGKVWGSPDASLWAAA